MQADIYNFEKSKVGTVDLPERVFGAKWKPILVSQVVRAQLANLRLPWASAKDRSEVRGGGKKPWRQKGTGRARHGSIRSPLWVGGGKAHGPISERDYTQKVNKKMKRQALASILSKKLQEGEVRILDDLNLTEPKTKILAVKLKAFLGTPKGKSLDVLLVPDSENKKLFRAARNLAKTKPLGSNSLNVYDLMNYKHILIDQKAIGEIVKHYSSSK